MKPDDRKTEISPSPRKIRRPLQRLARWGLSLVAALTALLLAGYLLLQLPSVQAKIRRLAVGAVERNLAVQMELDRISGNLLQNLILHDVRLYRDGRRWLAAERIAIRYRLLPLLRRSLHIRHLHGERLNLRLTRDASGQWDLPAPDKSTPSPSSAAKPIALRIDRFTLADSQLRLAPGNRQPVSIRNLDLEGGLKTGATVQLNLRRAGFWLHPAAISVNNLHGLLRYDPEERRLEVSRAALETSASRAVFDGTYRAGEEEPYLDAQLRFDALSLAELDRLLPGPSLQDRALRGAIRLTGTPAALHHQIRLEMKSLHFTAEGRTMISADLGWQLETRGSLEDFDPGDLPLSNPVPVGGRLSAEYSLKAQDLLNPTRRAQLSLNLLPSRIGAVMLQAGGLSMALEGDTLRVRHGSIQASPGALQFRGRIANLSGKPDLNAEIAVRSMRLEQIPLPVQVSGTLNADLFLEAALTAAKFTHPASWRGRAALQGHPSTLEGLNLRDARVQANWNQGVLVVDSLRLHADAAEVALSGRVDSRIAAWEMQGDVAVTDLQRLRPLLTRFAPVPGPLAVPAGRVQTSGSARGRGRKLESTLTLQANLEATQPVWPAQWAPSGTLNFSGALDFHHDGHKWSDPSGWSGQLEMQIDSPSRLWDAEIRKSSLRASWDGRVLQIPQLEIDTAVGTASLHGEADPQARTADVSGRIEIAQFARLRPIWQRLAPQAYRQLSAGSLRVEGSGAVDGGALEVTADLLGRDLSLQGVSAASVKLKTRWKGRTDDFKSSISGRVERISARDLRLAELNIAAEGTHRLLALDLQATTENEGTLRLSGQAEGWLGPQTGIRIETLAVRNPPAPLQPWLTEIHNPGPLVFRVSEDALEIDAMTLALDGAELRLTGGLRRSGNQRLGVTLQRFPLRNLFEGSGVETGVEGRLGLEARISGTWDDPEMTTALTASIDPNAGGLPTAVDARLVYRRDGLRVEGRGRRDGTLLFEAVGGVALEVRLVPFEIRPLPGTLDVTLTSDGLALALLPLPGFDSVDVNGFVDLELHAAGDLWDPDLAGSLALKNGSLRMPAAGLSYEEFSARLRLEPDRIQMERLVLRGDREGSLTASGTIGLLGWQPSEFDLEVAGENLRVGYRDVAWARMDADLRCTGSRERPVLTGRLAVMEGQVDLDRLATGRPSEIEVIGAPAPETRRLVYTDEKKEHGVLHSLEADVLVEIQKDTWLKGQGVNAEITGNLELQKPSEKPFRLFGSLAAVRGTYKFQGRVFRITAGTVSFTGLPEPNPELDIEAKTEVRRVAILLNISGRADNLRLSLRSDPDMQQSDILSYLVFGRPSSELRWQQSASVENAALGMTGNLAAAEFERIFEDALHLDMLTFEFSDEDFAQSTVTVGKYVTRDIFVSYRRGIATQGFGQVEVQYQISRNFTLQTQLGEEKTSGVDLIWELDF